MTSLWRRANLDVIFPAILRRTPGQFMNVYEMACTMQAEYPDEYQRLGLMLGGKGTRSDEEGRHLGVAWYLAWVGKRQVDAGRLPGVEHQAMSDLRNGMVAAHTRAGQTVLASKDAPSGFRWMPQLAMRVGG